MNKMPIFFWIFPCGIRRTYSSQFSIGQSVGVMCWYSVKLYCHIYYVLDALKF